MTSFLACWYHSIGAPCQSLANHSSGNKEANQKLSLWKPAEGSGLILPREARGPLRWRWQLFHTHSYTHRRTHRTFVSTLGLALWLQHICSLWPSSLRSARAIESERGNRHIFFHVAGTQRGDANGISMGLEPRAFRSRRTEAGLHELELKPTQL